MLSISLKSRENILVSCFYYHHGEKSFCGLRAKPAFGIETHPHQKNLYTLYLQPLCCSIEINSTSE